MPILAKRSEKTFVPCPSGVQQAVCCDIVDLGLVEATFAGVTKKKHMVRLCWQSEELNPEDGKPFLAMQRYTLSLDEKATLRKHLESWRGKPFTDEELGGFDLERLIGVNCLLNIVHNAKSGSTYANVAAVMPIRNGMEKLQVRAYVRVKDRTDGPAAGGHDLSNELTEDDIPFAWLLPLVLPVLSSLTLWT